MTRPRSLCPPAFHLARLGLLIPIVLAFLATGPEDVWVTAEGGGWSFSHARPPIR